MIRINGKDVPYTNAGRHRTPAVLAAVQGAGYPKAATTRRS